jgi:hypothetical protein
MIIVYLIIFSLAGCASISSSQKQLFRSCQEDNVRLEERSKELAALVQADQDDRRDWNKKSAEEMLQVAKRDVERRKRVGEIFGEGCFSKAEDFAAAALVYQHGNVPEHFFQTFIWAKRAVELGDLRQRRMMAMGIDRYLVNIGHKQLFGSQATKPDFKSESCWCLQQVEKSFPDQRRKELADKTLSEAFAWLKELNSGMNCPIVECEAQLKSSPEGTTPGFW